MNGPIGLPGSSPLHEVQRKVRAGWLLSPTVQNFTTAGSGTYTTPLGVRWIRVRAVGASGGSGGNGTGSPTAGGNGTATVFNSVTADFGDGGGASSSATGGTGGAGGSGGSGTATLRWPGTLGQAGSNGVSLSNFVTPTAIGGGSFFGGGGGTAPPVNSGIGAGGVQSGSSSYGASGAGGGAEYFELIIDNPAATYAYTVGTKGAAGGAGTGGSAGIAGSDGRIIVEEYYA